MTDFRISDHDGRIRRPGLEINTSISYRRVEALTKAEAETQRGWTPPGISVLPNGITFDGSNLHSYNPDMSLSHSVPLDGFGAQGSVALHDGRFLLFGTSGLRMLSADHQTLDVLSSVGLGTNILRGVLEPGGTVILQSATTAYRYDPLQEQVLTNGGAGGTPISAATPEARLFGANSGYYLHEIHTNLASSASRGTIPDLGDVLGDPDNQVTFVDQRIGWKDPVRITKADPDILGSPAWQFASTDAGFVGTTQPYRYLLKGLNNWALLPIADSSANHIGAMLVHDGGGSWAVQKIDDLPPFWFVGNDGLFYGYFTATNSLIRINTSRVVEYLGTVNAITAVQTMNFGYERIRMGYTI